MTTTITDGPSSVTPILIEEYVHHRPTRSIVHDTIGRPDPDVTLRAAGTRRGTLRAVLNVSADVDALDTMLRRPTILTVASTDEPRLNGLRFVVAGGEIRAELAGATTWVVEWPYVEVPA